jgi:hypothetical protein
VAFLLSGQSRGGADAGHKRRDSNGSALVSKLSGRPPALSTDFSSLEQMAEEADKEGGAGTQEDPARRRQSYFRVRLLGGFGGVEREGREEARRLEYGSGSLHDTTKT